MLRSATDELFVITLMQPKIFFLVYVSSAGRLFTTKELLAILGKFKRNNDLLGITGMLLYKDGNFIQALEGEEQNVRNLFAKVSRDPRHRGVMTLAEGFRAERQFSGWSMAFRNLDEPEARTTPGYSEFLNTALTSPEFTSEPDRCQRLLLAFKNNMR